MHALVPAMLGSRDSDTKNLATIVKIIHLLVSVRGLRDRKYQGSMNYYSYSKQMMINVITGKKNHMRGLLVERSFFQHARRLAFYRLSNPCNQQHADLADDLLTLSVSSYAKVRAKAQVALFSTFYVFPHRKKHVITQVLDILAHEDGLSHHRLKGVLFVLNTRSLLRFLLYKWDLLAVVTDRLANLRSNDRQSVQVLVNRVFARMHQECRPISVQCDVTPAALQAALQLHPATATLADSFDTSAAEAVAAKTAVRLQHLDNLILSLTGLLADSDTHWRYELNLAQILLFLLTLERISPKVATLFVRCMGHDSLHMRNLAMRGINQILAQDKVKMAKMPCRIRADGAGPIAETEAASDAVMLVPTVVESGNAMTLGPREDNRFCWFETDPTKRFHGKDRYVS